ncbi:GGDEF domain-containing protein [uncultured Sphaerochaeta sp.]|uniref:GGDEF domain-containing protein n=1 Tax=uncultured Sphaerochaeta sp. TaxID=886478 RepID=UPI002AA69416|nr:GGDEF domain-containing protein [uncultured Sphaerochaeta sp.]
MTELISNILRGSVSSVMYVLLLMTLTKSRFDRKRIISIAIFVFVINMTSTLWFYFRGDLTGLSRFTVLMFIVVGLLIKSFTKMSFMQWSFTFLTTINIAMMIIILSFHLGRLFPYPQYANTFFRFVLYLLVITMFRKHFLRTYQTVVSDWPVFSGLMICIFLNLSYFFFVTDDIMQTLATNRWPLLLLVALSLSAYGTVFFSFKRFLAMYDLEKENMKIQRETEVLQKVATELEIYANSDTLTGLPNRRIFFTKLETIVSEAKTNAIKCALLYIDLDSFKVINDTYGHEVGDGVLVTVGRRLLNCVRETDFVARLAGDEFAIIMQDIEDTNQAKQFAMRVHSVLQEPIAIDTITCSINASIGISIYPEAGDNGEALLRNADSAMYEIKKHGKGGIGIYNHNVL